MEVNIDELDREIKKLHDSMLEIRLNNTLAKHGETRLEEYRELRKKMARLKFKKNQIIGGIENDKYKSR